MKICIAQTQSIKGDIPQNINYHLKFIDLAVENNTDIIIFPELSLTGYEPTLVKALATYPNDDRFEEFQHRSNKHQIIIGIGIPIKSKTGICISIVMFYPDERRTVYSKQYLHPDEEPFFIAGQNQNPLIENKRNIALAICYEISIPEHSETLSNLGAEIYIASVAKSEIGVKKAKQQLSAIAKKHKMTVFMANCIGPADNFIGGGQSAIWNKQGQLICQLNQYREGILIFDIEKELLIKIFHFS